MEDTKYIFAKAIKELLLKKPLDKVTVIDIVSNSGLSRQTFYRHFLDKYDLVNWYFEKLVLKSFREMAEGSRLKDALVLKFTFIQNEHRFFKEAFKSNDYNNLKDYDFHCIYQFYRDILVKHNYQITADLDFLLRMYCRGSIDMTVEWIVQNMPISIMQITTLLIAALPKELENIFIKEHIM